MYILIDLGEEYTAKERYISFDGVEDVTFFDNVKARVTVGRDCLPVKPVKPIDKLKYKPYGG
jgi:hypothetical protein